MPHLRSHCSWFFPNFIRSKELFTSSEVREKLLSARYINPLLRLNSNIYETLPNGTTFFEKLYPIQNQLIRSLYRNSYINL